MMTVWKYQIPFGSISSFQMPHGATPVLTGMQSDRVPTMWMLLNALNHGVGRSFVVAATGSLVEGRHCGSFQDGDYVWHIYEV